MTTPSLQQNWLVQLTEEKKKTGWVAEGKQHIPQEREKDNRDVVKKDTVWATQRTVLGFTGWWHFSQYIFNCFSL